MKPKIIFVKDLRLYKDQKRRLESLGDVVYHNESLETNEQWLERCKAANIICSGMFGLKSDKVYELNNVFISLPFVGFEFLDINKLKERNISVSNSPGCNKEDVVEWIVGMLLMHFRQLNTLNRTKDSDVKNLKASISLLNKNITILGNGHIGNHLKEFCKLFGMHVKMFKRGDDLKESVKNADIIANCLSINSSSKGLLDREFFNSLKKGSFFISIARQLTYDINALKEALDNEILIGAADEAASAAVGDIDDPNYLSLIEHPKILVTPHIAWNTDARLRKANDMMIDNIEAWINKKPINLIY